MMHSFLVIPLMLGLAFIIPALSFRKERYVPWIALAGASASVLLTLLTIPGVISEGVLTMHMEGWKPPFGIALSLDAFGLMLALIISSIGFLTVLFSFRFIEMRKAKYYTLVCLLIAGLFGIVHTGDLFNLYVFYEISGIAGYILTSYYVNRSSIEGSIKFLIVGSFGTSLILLGIAFIYSVTGTVNMADIAAKAATEQSRLIPFALSLLLSGFAIKSAVFPFHAWKPDAVSVMPAPLTAMMAVSSSSVGIYSIIRIVYSVFAINSVAAYSMLIGIGVLTMVVGAVMALQQDGLMRMLAYSSISQIGFVLTAFGMGLFNSLGYTAAIYHMINIAVIEALLFFSAGVIIHETGTSSMSRLGGLHRMNPLFSYIFLIGILSNAGVPLLNGFASKWLIYASSLSVFPLVTAAAVIASVLAFLYGIRAYSMIFMGHSGKSPKGLELSMIIPLLALAGFCIMLGVFPQIGMQASEFIWQTLESRVFIGGII